MNQPTAEEERLKEELSAYVGLPKCQDCGWKLGSRLTDTCSCDSRNTIPDIAAIHSHEFKKARELQERLVKLIGYPAYEAWDAKRYRDFLNRSRL